MTPGSAPPDPAAELSVLGVRVQSWTVESLHCELARLVTTRAHALALHVNVHAINLAWKDPWLREFFNAAHLVFCDGAGVRLGAFLLGHRLPPRITYADWIWQLAAFAESAELSFFFLGGKPGIADRAAERLREKHPALRVLGCHSGYFDQRAGSAESAEVVRAINAARPDFLLIGFGMPLQERWLADHWAAIDAAVALTGGAVFDYASGELRRAPRWMTDHGLEWLGRLLIEPRRLWRRYLAGNSLFLFRVLRQRVFGKRSTDR